MPLTELLSVAAYENLRYFPHLIKEKIMKMLRQLCIAALLLLASSVPVLAGWMPNGITGTTASPPPAAAPADEIQPPVAGDILTPPSSRDATINSTDAATTLLETVLVALQGQLALL